MNNKPEFGSTHSETEQEKRSRLYRQIQVQTTISIKE